MLLYRFAYIQARVAKQGSTSQSTFCYVSPVSPCSPLPLHHCSSVLPCNRHHNRKDERGMRLRGKSHDGCLHHCSSVLPCNRHHRKDERGMRLREDESRRMLQEQQGRRSNTNMFCLSSLPLSYLHPYLTLLLRFLASQLSSVAHMFVCLTCC
jgi:hypothetical protein